MDDRTRATDTQRDIQHQQDQKDQARPKKDKQQAQRAVQAGQKAYPQPPFPAQHIDKPGSEAEMAARPQYLAPHYKGSGKLQDRVAVITGGDSGIGRAVAVLFAREGADVAIVYLNEHEDAEETRRSVEKEGCRCLAIAGDVRDPAFCHDAIEQAVSAFGRLDILVNNAAFQEHAESLLDLSEERFDHTMKTNIYGYFHMAKAALPHLKQGAAIINTSSVTALRGSAHLLDYSTTKGAIIAFTRSLAANLVEQGIRVNAVAPGPVWTPLNPADRPAGQVAKFGGQTDMKRPAQPEEISPAYVYLASPACSSFVTGIVLPITGSVGE